MRTTHREEGITIAVPAHDEAGNLLCLVRSVLAAFAGHPHWELIVVDDGSRDDTLSVLAELQRETRRLRVIRHLTRCGQSAAIWTAADAARYPWIGFLDADGQNDPRDLERLYRQILEADDPAPTWFSCIALTSSNPPDARPASDGRTMVLPLSLCRPCVDPVLARPSRKDSAGDPVQPGIRGVLQPRWPYGL